MRDAVKTILAASAGLIVTIAALLVVTAWSFAWVDLAMVVVFLVGVGVGFWIASVLRV